MKRILLIAMLFSAVMSANSQVVYTNLESNPVVINSYNSEYEINLMGGETEFSIQNYANYGEAIYFACFSSGSAIVGTTTDYNANVNILSEGTPISQSSSFWGHDQALGVGFGILYLPNSYESWIASGINYVGFKFQNGSNTHYGWAKLSLEGSGENTAVKLYGYAYQSTPNTSITAGETGGTSSLENEIESKFLVYPNPANNVLNIETIDNIQNISIINSIGQEVLTSNSTRINIENLNSGVYFLNIVTNEGIARQKFIKK
ncbi:MAG: T9SS type A sorting domain-containing protein [Bacteroidota bacterium]|nr:T9SS type A sorting domain-containing protein [Bacteroidota bacterium]